MTIPQTAPPERTATAAELADHAARMERARRGGPAAVPEPPADRARIARCGACWAEPGDPCGDARGDLAGPHLARFARARRRGLITEAEMASVLESAGDVFTPDTVIWDEGR